MKGGKLRGQLIGGHHVATPMRRIVPVGMRQLGIDPCFFDVNLQFDDHHGMPVRANSLLSKSTSSSLVPFN